MLNPSNSPGIAQNENESKVSVLISLPAPLTKYQQYIQWYSLFYTHTHINNFSKCWHSNRNEPIGYHVQKHICFVYSFLFHIDCKNKEIGKDSTSQSGRAGLNLMESSMLDLLSFYWPIISLFLRKEGQICPYSLYNS